MSTVFDLGEVVCSSTLFQKCDLSEVENTSNWGFYGRAIPWEQTFDLSEVSSILMHLPRRLFIENLAKLFSDIGALGFSLQIASFWISTLISLSLFFIAKKRNQKTLG